MASRQIKYEKDTSEFLHNRHPTTRLEEYRRNAEAGATASGSEGLAAPTRRSTNAPGRRQRAPALRYQSYTQKQVDHGCNGRHRQRVGNLGLDVIYVI